MRTYVPTKLVLMLLAAGVASLALALAVSAPAATPSAKTGIAHAKAQVKLYKAIPPLKVKRLSKRPPRGVKIALVNCTLSSCAPHTMEVPAKALGWKLTTYEYDLTKGPSDYVSAVTRAIASKPDFVATVAVFPESIIAKQVAAAKKSGVKFIDIGGKPTPGYEACIQCPPPLLANGKLSADIALADAGKPTTMAVANDPVLAPLVHSVNGVKAEVARYGQGSKALPLDLSLSSTPGANIAKTISFLQRNPDVKYIIYTTPNLTTGVKAALKSAGLGSVKLIGMSPAGPGDIAQLKTGEMFAWVGGETQWAWRSIDAAARVSLGQKVVPFAPVSNQRVLTASNANAALVNPPNFRTVWPRAWRVK